MSLSQSDPLEFLSAGNPIDNAAIEAFNSRSLLEFSTTLVSGSSGCHLKISHVENQCLAEGLQSSTATWIHRQSGADGSPQIDPSATDDGF